ncbi:MAG: DUF4258 domain-containing protein [Candidatus Bathycorpusculaceae bacterium]
MALIYVFGKACHCWVLQGLIAAQHAKQRMRDREITEAQISKILQEPKETISVKYGRLAVYREIKNRKLVVIYEKRNENIEVVTLC